MSDAMHAFGTIITAALLGALLAIVWAITPKGFIRGAWTFLRGVLTGLVLPFCVYIALAWCVFAFRHPSAGPGALLRFLPAVLRFETVPNL